MGCDDYYDDLYDDPTKKKSTKPLSRSNALKAIPSIKQNRPLNSLKSSHLAPTKANRLTPSLGNRLTPLLGAAAKKNPTSQTTATKLIPSKSKIKLAPSLGNRLSSSKGIQSTASKGLLKSNKLGSSLGLSSKRTTFFNRAEYKRTHNFKRNISRVEV